MAFAVVTVLVVTVIGYTYVVWGRLKGSFRDLYSEREVAFETGDVTLLSKRLGPTFVFRGLDGHREDQASYVHKVAQFFKENRVLSAKFSPVDLRETGSVFALAVNARIAYVDRSGTRHLSAEQSVEAWHSNGDRMYLVQIDQRHKTDTEAP